MKFQVESTLNDALATLLERDAFILEADVNERAISHQLAVYLARLFEAWNVDCEYNRNHDDPKRLDIPRRDVRTDDTEARTVFPDIIVHKRGTDENLLVVEMKKTTSQEDDEFDFRKLAAFKEQLGYKFAVFVKLRTNGESGVEDIRWI